MALTGSQRDPREQSEPADTLETRLAWEGIRDDPAFRGMLDRLRWIDPER
ncbi:MAG TPA: hypothetical protein VMM79_02270 [Longimicrobiales bacterium]|nr:hypothetical protein [Longimicrobiales bacterium]